MIGDLSNRRYEAGHACTEHSVLNFLAVPKKNIAQKNDGQMKLARRRSWREGAEAAWENARGVRRGRLAVQDERSVVAARARYEKAIEEAGRVSRKAVSRSFEESREKTFQEFKEFWGSVGGGEMREARGVDIVAFIQGWWLPQHERNFRTRVPGREGKVVSASAVKGVVSQLAKSFSMLGLTDDENPAKTEAVRSYREGYRVKLWEQGVREKEGESDAGAEGDGIGRVSGGGNETDVGSEEVRRSDGSGNCVVSMGDVGAGQRVRNSGSTADRSRSGNSFSRVE